jgi:mannose-6-phosphate isomerase class I
MEPGLVVLRPDNLTPPARTPWGGRKIIHEYKPFLTQAGAVGESWEVSVEPSFPSRALSGDAPLSALIAGDPVGWLGAEVAARYGGQSPLLVKLLDAAAPLSVQVHPAEGDPALGPDESGKPEGWIVLEASPSAGIFLGFRREVTRAQVERCLREGGPLDALMNFVSVAPGDAFAIEAGTAHAIGAGVTLLEPQHITPGRCGVTYRFWDWDRRYDPHGQPDPAGQPRPLHVARSLEVTRWDGLQGVDFVDSCRCAPEIVAREGALERAVVMRTPWFWVERLRGQGAAALETQDRMVAATCVKGVLRMEGGAALRAGYSGVIAARAGAFTASVEGPGEVFLVRSA